MNELQIVGNYILNTEDLTREERIEAERIKLLRGIETLDSNPKKSHTVDSICKYIGPIISNNQAAEQWWGFKNSAGALVAYSSVYFLMVENMVYEGPWDEGFYSIPRDRFSDNDLWDQTMGRIHEDIDRYSEGYAYSADFHIQTLLNRITDMERVKDINKSRIVFAEDIIDRKKQTTAVFKVAENGELYSESKVLGKTFIPSRDIVVLKERDIKPGVLYKVTPVNTYDDVIEVAVIGPHAPVRAGIFYSGKAFYRDHVEKANTMDQYIDSNFILPCINSSFQGLCDENGVRMAPSQPVHVMTSLLKDALLAVRAGSRKVRIYFPHKGKQDVIKLEALDPTGPKVTVMMSIRNLSAGVQRG